MRTVVITTSYPQSPGDPAGHFVETEALDLAGRGHEVHVLAPGSNVRRGSNLTIWGVGGGSLFGFPGALARARSNPFLLLQLGDFLPGVRRRLAELRPVDRVVAHFLVPSGYPLALGVSGEIEVVLHGSDVAVFNSFPSPLRTYVARRLLEHHARFRFVSESLRQTLLAKLRPREREQVAARSRVEPARISVERMVEADLKKCRSILGRGDRPRWVACARLVRSKRVDLAIREAARRGADLTVIGDGPERRSLERLAMVNEPRARFLGQLPRGQALAFIASADRLIHTSEAEGAPTVIREARALGIPVLAAPSGDVARWAETDPGIELLPAR